MGSASRRGRGEYRTTISSAWLKGLCQILGDSSHDFWESAGCRINTVILQSSSIGKEGARHLAQVVEKNSRALQVLALPMNSIGNPGLEFFDTALRHNGYLTHLDLTNNKITAKGVVSLSQGLRDNRSLRVLDLSENHIKDKGAAELADKILWGRRETSTLVEVLLRGCLIGCEGAGQLARALQGHTPNRALKKLDLSNNNIQNKGAGGFKNVLGREASGFQ